MDNKNKKNDLQNERELIYLLLHNKDAIDSFYDFGMAVKSFSDENAPIVAAILETYDMNGVLLTRKTFKEKLKLYKIPKEKISQELAFNSCYSAKASMDDMQMLVNKIIERTVECSITKVFDDFTKDSSKKGNIPAIKNLVGSCEEILDGATVSSEKTYYEDIRTLSISQIQYIEDVRSGKIKEEPLILTGIREMDYTMVTGLEAGTLTLICADVAGYKSTTLLNIGLNVWNNKFDVLFVPLEMRKEQMWRRACAREARVPSQLITRDIKNITDEQMEKIRNMNEAWKSNPAQFYMMQEPGNTTVKKIERQIENNIELIRPRLVVIDYVANLEAHKNRYGRNDLEIGDMLKTMRQMGKDLNFAVLSAAQLGREALKRIRKVGSNRDKTSINSEDIRGSHEYAADADNIFAQLKSTSQPNQLLDIFCVKSRNGPTVFENGNVRATLDIHPEFGLIMSPPEYDSPDDPEEDDANNKFDADLGELMDKIEGDDIIINNKIFEENDDMYNYNSDFYNKDDNSDIENAIEEEGELVGWNDNF